MHPPRLNKKMLRSRSYAKPHAEACPYCKRPPELVSGEVLYPDMRNLHSRLYWRCKPCDAYVGCHTGTSIPLGRLANLELRKLKILTHHFFDVIWRNAECYRKVTGDTLNTTDSRRRVGAYAWLGNKMQLKKSECHVGLFDESMCGRAIAICKDAIDAAGIVVPSRKS